jgi:hypothetical protein
MYKSTFFNLSKLVKHSDKPVRKFNSSAHARICIADLLNRKAHLLFLNVLALLYYIAKHDSNRRRCAKGAFSA